MQDFEEEVKALRARVGELEEALRERETADPFPAPPLLRALLSLPIGLFRIDEDGVFTDAVGDAFTQLGLKAKQLIGLNIFDLFPEVEDNVRRALGGGVAFHETSGEFEGRPWAALTNVAYDHERGSGAIAVSLDVTALRKARAELEASEHRFAALADNFPVGVARTDTEGRVLYINDESCRMAATTVEEAIGREWFDWVHPDDHKRVVEEWIQRADTHGLIVVTYRLLSKDGSSRWVMAHIVEDRDSDGNLRGYLGTTTDIADHKKVEAEIRRLNDELNRRVAERTSELEEARREMEVFSYSVSHDLRAPLRSVAGFCQAALEDYGERLDEEGRSYLERASAASQKMDGLIDDLLDMSRAVRGELHSETLDLSDMARAIVADLRRRDPERTVDVKVADGLTTIGDLGLINDLLRNLLGNAWKFTKEQAEAHIELGQAVSEEGSLAFFVRDDGVGFEQNEAERMFTAFVRLHPPSAFDGNGIGLATVERIVRRHQGRIWAEGRPGTGATFYFTLGGQK